MKIAALVSVLLASTILARADSITVVSLPIDSSVNPVAYGLALDDSSGNEIADLQSVGDAVFTSSDPGFGPLAAYMLNPNQPLGLTLLPYYLFNGRRNGLVYVGHLDAYPLPTGTINSITIDVQPPMNGANFGFAYFSAQGTGLVPESGSTLLLMGLGLLLLVLVRHVRVNVRARATRG